MANTNPKTIPLMCFSCNPLYAERRDKNILHQNELMRLATMNKSDFLYASLANLRKKGVWSKFTTRL